MLGSDTLFSPPRLCPDNSPQNLSRYRNVSSDLDGEDYEILNILKEMLEGSKESESFVPEFKKRSEVMKDFKSGLTTVENILCGPRHKVLTDTEIDVSEKDLDFAPIQYKISESELRHDFNELCRRIRLKWNFRDERRSFNETQAFTPKSTGRPLKGHTCLKVFLSQVGKETFEIPFLDLKYSNMTREEWQAVRSCDRSIVIKKQIRGLVQLYGTETGTY